MKLILSDYNNSYETHPEVHGLVDAVVTGKGVDEFDDIDSETKQTVPVYMNPMKKNDIIKGYPLTVVNHKANIINKTGASIFIEDELQEVQLLKLFCPKTRIIHAEDGKDLTNEL